MAVVLLLVALVTGTTTAGQEPIRPIHESLGAVASPQRAERVAVTVQVTERPPWAGQEGTYRCRYGMGATPCCPQWWGTALAVGWPMEAMAKLDYVMGRESRCNAGAYNGTSCGGGHHAIGLTQLCGWGGGELFNPSTNLSTALRLWRALGWHPWCLDGVTGRC